MESLENFLNDISFKSGKKVNNRIKVEYFIYLCEYTILDIFINFYLIHVI